MTTLDELTNLQGDPGKFPGCSLKNEAMDLWEEHWIQGLNFLEDLDGKPTIYRWKILKTKVKITFPKQKIIKDSEGYFIDVNKKGESPSVVRINKDGEKALILFARIRKNK